jgi:hypothetical protein
MAAKKRITEQSEQKEIEGGLCESDVENIDRYGSTEGP